MAPRFALAARKARELLNEGKVKTAPVPVKRLAVLVGAEVRYQPYAGDLSGAVHRGEGRAVIGVNSLHSATRQRFTIAHEIGHLLLHKDENLHIDERFPIGLRSNLSSLGVDAKEIEANQFAAELLMPVGLLFADLEGQQIDIENETAISQIAKKYQVSSQAMTIRIGELARQTMRPSGLRVGRRMTRGR